jgi:hypothetical protein
MIERTSLVEEGEYRAEECNFFMTIQTGHIMDGEDGTYDISSTESSLNCKTLPTASR